MQLIRTIVRPDKLEDVQKALEKLPVPGMTVMEVRGQGRAEGQIGFFRGVEAVISLLPKTQIELLVNEDLVDAAVRAIMGAARTGTVGDGIVFVSPVSDSYRIRTGDWEGDVGR